MSGETEYYERIKRENELKQDEGGVRGRVGRRRDDWQEMSLRGMRSMNLTDDSKSVNENDGWVFDDLACNVLEEESVRRSISRQIHCTCRWTDLRGQPI